LVHDSNSSCGALRQDLIHYIAIAAGFGLGIAAFGGALG
jgi:hypothetical protein